MLIGGLPFSPSDAAAGKAQESRAPQTDAGGQAEPPDGPRDQGAFGGAQDAGVDHSDPAGRSHPRRNSATLCA